MKNFNVTPWDGHIIANIDGNDAVVDTGSPVTLARRGTYKLPSLGCHEINGSIAGCSVERLNEAIGGSEFQVLLGVDILGKSPFLVDWANQEITFNAIAPEGGITIGLDDSLGGCPIVNADVNSFRSRMIVDTGAKVTYIKEAFCSNGEVLGRYSDFFPIAGGTEPFVTGAFAAKVKIGDLELNLAAGNLPFEFEAALNASGIDGILGNDIFDQFGKVCFDLNGQLTFYRTKGRMPLLENVSDATIRSSVAAV